jgi:hypothetical protein
MNDKSLPATVCKALLAALLCLGLTSPAPAAEPQALTRSDQPQTVSDEGDRELVVEGPFGLAWQSAGGRFSIEATAEGADRPAAVSATQGKGQGRIKLHGQQRYQVSINADGPWALTVTW